MQIEQFTKVRNISIVVTVISALVMILCYFMDTNHDDVEALKDYLVYSRVIVDDGTDNILPEILSDESCSIIMKKDAIYKSNPDHKPRVSFYSVDDIKEFTDGWSVDKNFKVNPYINAYIKQSLWEYADWCIDEESPDYWHMKYIASQMTGGYSYARQIKYKWYKMGYDNVLIIVIISLFTFIFVNVLCILYGLNGVVRHHKPVQKMPRWNNDCRDGEE